MAALLTGCGGKGLDGTAETSGLPWLFVLTTLLALFVVVGIGWVVGRLQWLGDRNAVQTMSNAATYIFIPALLFRSMARLDMAHLPWGILAAFFIPALLLLLAVYAWQRRALARQNAPLPVTGPSVRAMGCAFGNSVHMGLPLTAALFGEDGLAIHITITALNSLVILTTATLLAESDLARQRLRKSRWRMLATTVRSALIHPVILPILCGLTWQWLFGRLPTMADGILLTLSQVAPPFCMVLIGLSLAQCGVRGLRQASVLVAMKLLVLPLVVGTTARWALGLTGLPLAVVVLAAALPIGVNSVVFARRYKALEAEATTAVVVSTVAFMLTAPLWLGILSTVNPSESQIVKKSGEEGAWMVASNVQKTSEGVLTRPSSSDQKLIQGLVAKGSISQEQADMALRKGFRSVQTSGVPLRSSFDMLAADGDVAVTLRRWGQANGYKVSWEAGVPALVTGDITLNAKTFLEALSQVIMGLQNAGYSIRVQTPINNQIRVTNNPGASQERPANAAAGDSMDAGTSLAPSRVWLRLADITPDDSLAGAGCLPAPDSSARPNPC